MVMMRDVWVNWFEGEENGYNVCEFHEWRSEDRVEVLDQVKLIKASSQLFSYIEDQLLDLPEALLESVHQKSYLRKNMSRIQLDYCFIVCDGERILAVDTMGYKTPIRKSRMTPRQEQLIYEALVDQEIEQFDLERKPTEKEYHMLSLSPADLQGLTRKERQLKQLLFMVLDQLHSSASDAELKYWCTEWNPLAYEKLRNTEREDVWNYLIDGVKKGWSPDHYALCEAMVKGHSFYEKLWELEHPERVK
ncbi:hypothetical protein JOC54_003664 [Alkalihalobacillus xiaoxiensis]|uniref:Uncharacterized protein n=1 Tax=Shouchella xiaoxiensis TaxID=766895 RepID=A0ABS2SXX8_9BACI|nr:YjbA family protein [Shouchella xiaoxiensis]MBM7840383.1 hypothetical protein [Shouchella xiaoxiensis]